MEAVRAIEFVTYDQTKCQPLTLILVLVCGTLIFLVPRRFCVVPLLAVVCFVHYTERFVIAGVDFEMVRVMLVLALLRIVFRNEIADIRLNRLDKAFLVFSGVTAAVPVLQNPGQIVWSAGYLLNHVIGFLILKTILSESRCIEIVASSLVIFSIPMAIGMLVERRFEVNPFHVLGAKHGIFLRDGEVRACAAFDHAILGGSFGSILFPFTIILWNQRARLLALAGLVTSLSIVYSSKSSGPLYGLIAGIFAVCLWRQRSHIARLRNVLWISLLVLQLCMSSPVYSLIFRIPDALSFISSSTSYHRYLVIDSAMKNVSQWWLLGTSLDVVGTWGYGVQDVTNHFIAVGYSSGLFGMLLFILVFVRGFSFTGQCVHSANADEFVGKTAWLLGTVLFVHLANFMGVSYASGFDFFFTLSLAMISRYCEPYLNLKERADTATEGAFQPQSA